jgi:hypothetical protein
VTGPLLSPQDQNALVASSWQRSADAGVDADGNVAPLAYERSELTDYRDEHPLARVFPLLYDVLGRTAEENDCVMAVGDAHGNLLWLSGRPTVLRRAESINFVEGAAWAEPTAGTNAPGTALRLDRPVHIRAEEHYTRTVQPWTCAAAPIHDPATHAILGVVDLTGGDEVAVPMTMGVVRAAARLAETELARLAALSESPSPDPVAAEPGLRGSRMQVVGLGRPECRVKIDDRVVRLSPRHSEIVMLLLDAPEGLTGDQLAVALYRDDVQPSTLRAELTRLKALLGEEIIGSRPYRLLQPAVSDWHIVEARLARGEVRSALSAYRGPLLPQSDAPGVVRRRELLGLQLRGAIMASNDVDLMVAWTRRRWGADDLDMWQHQVEVLPANSPLRPLALAEARRLDREFAAPLPLR